MDPVVDLLGLMFPLGLLENEYGHLELFGFAADQLEDRLFVVVVE